MRLFIAISLPERVKDALERVQEHMRGASPTTSVRWTRREQFHLTLKFLGNVDEQRLAALTGSIGGACSDFGALHLRVGQIGFFPTARRPRVIWTRVHDERDRLPSLQRKVEAAAAGFTSQAPEPEFTGHVTLGRCRMTTPSQAERLSKLAHAMDHSVFGEWTADSVDIIRSQASPGGSQYTTLASLPLARLDGDAAR